LRAAKKMSENFSAHKPGVNGGAGGRGWLTTLFDEHPKREAVF
jgi:hypothetical protein